jgi:predicted secreted Zn-dependent protease
VTGVQASFRSDVFLPRWTRPAAVEKDLKAWWQRMFRRIVAHEARHIAIANAALPDLRRRAQGKGCDSFRTVFTRWSGRLNKAQQTFDRREARRPLPRYRGEPVLP